jgi:hypothetical protein
MQIHMDDNESNQLIDLQSLFIRIINNFQSQTCIITSLLCWLSLFYHSISLIANTMAEKFPVTQSRGYIKSRTFSDGVQIFSTLYIVAHSETLSLIANSSLLQLPPSIHATFLPWGEVGKPQLGERQVGRASAND